MTDATIFAIMSRVNKVILATHAVIANGGLIAAAGARVIAKAARVHRTPVIVVSGVYKLASMFINVVAVCTRVEGREGGPLIRGSNVFP